MESNMLKSKKTPHSYGICFRKLQLSLPVIESV